MADVRCPICGKVNWEDLDTCQFCSARLTQPGDPNPVDPTPSLTGDTADPQNTPELNAREPGEDEPMETGEVSDSKNTGDLEQMLDSWLKPQQGKETKPETAPFVDASAGSLLPAEPWAVPAAGASSEDVDWLSGLDAPEAAGDQEIPDWMTGLRVPSPPVSDSESLHPLEQEPAMSDQDLMRRLEGEAGQPPDAPQEQAEAPTPDWLSTPDEEPETLQAVQTTGSDGSPASPLRDLPAEAVPSEDLPEWLLELKSKTKPADETPLSTENDVPGWLSSLPAIPAEAPASGPEIDPHWLNDLKESAAEPFYSADLDDQLPSLETETNPEAEVVLKDELSPAEALSTEIDDRLSQQRSELWEDPKAEHQAEVLEPSVKPFIQAGPGEPILDWLADVDQAGPTAAPTPIEEKEGGGAAPGEPELAAFPLEMPDWLSKLLPDHGVETVPDVQNDAEPEPLKSADLPSWVQAMRPLESVISETGQPPSDETGAVEAIGPLAGMSGVLPSTPGPGTMRRPPPYAVKMQVSSNQQRYAAQLEKMIMDEGKAKDRKPVRLVSNLVWRLGIAFVLILAVLIPLLAGSQFLPDMTLFPSEWEMTSKMLDEIPAEAPILMVFDYDPALSGELEASAAPVVDHILDRGTRLAIVSTIPTGPAMAEQFLDASQSSHLKTGLQVTNLGYLAGGPAGILSFAIDPVMAVALTVGGDPAWETSALEGVSRLEDFSALIILTDNADTGRAWIEQTRAAIDHGTPTDFSDDTPILMILSAQAEPLIRPYFNSGQIQGLVTGLAGGKVYEQSYGVPGLARRYWDSFGLGTLAAEIMIATGCAWGVIKAWRGRKNTGGKV